MRSLNQGGKRLSVRPLFGALAVAGLIGISGPAAAQVAAQPVEIEGPISGITYDPQDESATVTVFGVPFRVPKGTPISTPTRSDLTTGELADTGKFSGRSQDGFVGGTAIMVGESANGVTTITSVFAEPAENVALGVITHNDSENGIRALGIPLKPIQDGAITPRIPPEGFHNSFGFAVNPATVPVGAGAGVEGYFGEDGALHYFLVEVTAGDLLEDVPQTSILRARCDPGGRLEVQGASYQPAVATIEFRNKNNELFGNITTIASLEDPRFGDYRFRTDVNNGEVDSVGACPSVIKAVNLANGTEATATVDGVEAPPPLPPVNEPPVAVNDEAATFVGLATQVELTANDTDSSGNVTIDPTSVDFVLPAGSPLAVTNNNDGTVTVSSPATGIYTFTYTVADSGGLRSNEATVTVTVDAAPVDTVDITRANFRTGDARWNVRGTSNHPGVVVDVILVRGGTELGSIVQATADATGAWAIDVRGTALVAQPGDVVRAVSSDGGTDEEPVVVSR